MTRIWFALLAALVLPMPAAAADEYLSAGMTAQQLLSKADRASGWLESGAYHTVERVTSDRGDVWTTETYFRGDDYKATQRQGAFVTSWGSYRGQDWEQDENGYVTFTTGYVIEHDPFAVAYHRTEESDRVKMLGLTPDKAFYVIEVSPSTGLTQVRYYDANTYLLARIEQTAYDGHKRTWEYRDYRVVSGRHVAYSVTYRIDSSSDVSKSEMVTYEKVPAVGLSFDVPASKTLFDLGGRESVVIPAQFSNDGIFVRVSIAGRGLDFVLDSGSSDIVINPQVAREIGMGSSGSVTESFAGDYTIAKTRAPDFSIGDLSASNVALTTANFEEQGEDRRAVGLLGGDFFATGVLEVNFEKKVLTLHSAVPAGLAAAGWSVLPLRLDDQVPLVKATFSGREGYFIADLGADDSMLYPHYFSQFNIAIPKGTQDQGEGMTIGGKAFGILHFTMNRLALGDWIFGDVQVIVPSASYAQEPDYDGLIGRSTLASFNLIFDYKNHQLWFKPIDFK